MSKVSPEYEYFFAVGTPDTVMSSVWKVNTKPGKIDVYIQESGSGQQFHVSLHREKWQVTVWKEFTKYGRNRGKPNPAKSKTHPITWKVREIKPGLMMPFRILIPTSELRPPVPGWSTTQPVRWLDPPPADFVYEVRFYLNKSLLVILSPDGDIVELWKRPLTEGWELLVLAKALPFPVQEQREVELIRQQGLTVAAPLPESTLQDGRLRAIVPCSAGDGSWHFIDMAFDVPRV